MPLNLEVYRTEAGFDELRDEWNLLLDGSRFNSLFLTWEWQTTWWRCLGGGDLWLLAWREEGQLIAIAPLFLSTEPDGTRRFALVGCIEVSDYLDLIITAGHEAVIYESLMEWLASPDAPNWDEMNLCNLPQVSQTHQRLPELAATWGHEVISELEDVCPIIYLPGDWESYLQECLSKKQRHEVRRKMRRIENEASVHWYAVNDTTDLDAEMDAFIELHKLSAKEKHSFMTPDMEVFFREITRSMHSAGWLHLAFIKVNGTTAAGMLSFDYQGRILVYNSGYDPDSYADLSPGIVLTSYVIQDAIRRHRQIFDFLQGGEIYKYRFGAIDTAVYHTIIRKQQASTAT